MARVLVVYYSRSGHTRQVAAEIAAALGADTEELEDPSDRTGFWGYLRSAREALRRQLVEIHAPRRSIADYELVVIGTPVWASHIASPVRSYLAARAPALESVAFFCTQGGSGASRVLLDLEDLCGRSPLATLAVSEGELKTGQYREHLDEFARKLASALPASDAPPALPEQLQTPDKQRGCLAL